MRLEGVRVQCSQSADRSDSAQVHPELGLPGGHEGLHSDPLGRLPGLERARSHQALGLHHRVRRGRRARRTSRFLLLEESVSYA